VVSDLLQVGVASSSGDALAKSHGDGRLTTEWSAARVARLYVQPAALVPRADRFVVTLSSSRARLGGVSPRRFASCAVLSSRRFGSESSRRQTAFLNYLVLVLGVLLLDDEVLARMPQNTRITRAPRGGLTISNTPSWRGCSTRLSRRFRRPLRERRRARACCAVQNHEPIRAVRQHDRSTIRD
jgi:hypothetical protein